MPHVESTPQQQRRYGRRPPKNSPALRLGDFLTGVVPPHPVAADNLARLAGGWRMGGNDVAGDCVAVTWANFRRLITAVLSTENYPTQDQIWAIYRTQNPGFDPAGSADINGPGSDHDQGMDIQTLLEYLVKVGGPDGVKALAFAKVNPKAVDEVKAAISIFGGVWTGIIVLEANQQEFGDGHPWDFVKGSPVDGGHSVLTGGYGPQGAAPGALGGDERMITWAQETSFTEAYWGHEVEEVWVVVWPEHVGTKQFQEGINLAAMATAYTEITNGKPFPVVVPPVPQPGPPAPVPTPGPVPAQRDVILAAAMHAWLEDAGL